MLRKLLEDERVKFSGYKMPHPLENMIKIKIQTYEGYQKIIRSDLYFRIRADGCF
jgi:DNA-directed RNA polymerase subunit L